MHETGTGKTEGHIQAFTDAVYDRVVVGCARIEASPAMNDARTGVYYPENPLDGLKDGPGPGCVGPQ